MVNAKRTAIFSVILMLGTSGCYQTHLYLEASEQPPEPDAVVREIALCLRRPNWKKRVPCALSVRWSLPDGSETDSRRWSLSLSDARDV